MTIRRYEAIAHYKYQSGQLIRRMLSPFCGINQEIAYVSRTGGDKRLMVGTAALTGVHVLFDRPNPGRGAYHIGGTGIFPQESMIRILGESIERYAQLMSGFAFASQLRIASWRELNAQGEPVLPFDALTFYAVKQLSRPGFPFESATLDSPLAWIKMQSCDGSAPLYVPAQLVLVGYTVNKEQNEPWLTTAVTTGTAAHISYEQAFRSALLELIQLDTVIGHWYSGWKIYQIELDHRVSAFHALFKRYTSTSQHHYLFYYLPNPNLAGITVACVYLQEKGLPKVVIGLGADLSLESAMYKAFLETVASVGLARMVVFKGKNELDKHSSIIDPNQLYDLDRNVEYYGAGQKYSRIEERFLRMPGMRASDCPPDVSGTPAQQLRQLINSFKQHNKRLYYLDLTGSEEKALGFNVVRVWSPDTLSLCLPSAPQILHPRFNDYGGFKHADPHPYP